MAQFESPIQVFPPDGHGPYGDRWTIRNMADGGRIVYDTKTEEQAVAKAKESRKHYNARKRADREADRGLPRVNRAMTGSM